LPLAFFLGGLPVGVMARSYHGLNGVLSSTFVVVVGFVWLLATFLPGLLNPISNPGEVYTRSENLQMLLIYATAFGAVSPFGLLAGYLGGRLGGRLRLSTRS
jgi:hypothetical protein